MGKIETPKRGPLDDLVGPRGVSRRAEGDPWRSKLIRLDPFWLSRQRLTKMAASLSDLRGDGPKVDMSIFVETSDSRRRLAEEKGSRIDGDYADDLFRVRIRLMHGSEP